MSKTNLIIPQDRQMLKLAQKRSLSQKEIEEICKNVKLDVVYDPYNPHLYKPTLDDIRTRVLSYELHQKAKRWDKKSQLR